MFVHIWGLKMQLVIHLIIHMVEFEQQHLQKVGAISANGENSKIGWCNPTSTI